MGVDIVSYSSSNTNGLQSRSQPQMVEVVAPCAMEAGFTFMADYGGDRTFPVTVPPGGVQEGQTFSVPLTSTDLLLSPSEITPFIVNHHAVDVAHQADAGRWKDGLFDCFRYGYCHASVCNALFCPQLLMAQVLTRLKMNAWGMRSRGDEYKKTFGRVLIAVLVFWLLSMLLAPPSPYLIFDEQGNLTKVPPTAENNTSFSWSHLQRILFNLISFAMGLYTWWILTRLRHVIRTRYEIPPMFHNNSGDGCCQKGWLQDAGLAFFCGCCSVAQMARQTCEYEQQPAACCSRTGLGSSSGTSFSTMTL